MKANNNQTTEAQSSRSPGVLVSGCCGGPAPVGTNACCAKDAAVKSTGGTGCECGSSPQRGAPIKGTCCT
jgi:hypothetical protein